MSIFIAYDRVYDMVFAFDSLEAAKAACDRWRSNFGMWHEKGSSRWERQEIQVIVQRPVTSAHKEPQ